MERQKVLMELESPYSRYSRLITPPRFVKVSSQSGGGVKVLGSQRWTCSNGVSDVTESTKDFKYSAHAPKVDEV